MSYVKVKQFLKYTIFLDRDLDCYKDIYIDCVMYAYLDCFNNIVARLFR